VARPELDVARVPDDLVEPVELLGLGERVVLERRRHHPLGVGGEVDLTGELEAVDQPAQVGFARLIDDVGPSEQGPLDPGV
jgi:hypothetical protein